MLHIPNKLVTIDDEEQKNYVMDHALDCGFQSKWLEKAKSSKQQENMSNKLMNDVCCREQVPPRRTTSRTPTKLPQKSAAATNAAATPRRARIPNPYLELNNLSFC